MSTLRANSIEHTDGGPIAMTKQTPLKLYVEVDQDTSGHPATETFNVASTTDVNTGLTTVTYTNNFNSANYAIAGTGQPQNESGGTFGVEGRYTGDSRQNKTSSFTSQCRVMNTNSHRDIQYFGAMIGGTLA